MPPSSPKRASATCSLSSVFPSATSSLVTVNDGTSDVLEAWVYGDPAEDPARPRIKEVTRLAREAAARIGLELREGVYAAWLGPAFETPAEIRMMRTLGADLVGMSTVPEVLAARHMGIRCLALSCVTNAAAGVRLPVRHWSMYSVPRSMVNSRSCISL